MPLTSAQRISYHLPKSLKLSPKLRHFVAVLCILPLSLWAHNAKLGQFLSTNTPGATTIAAFKGFAGQPTLGTGTLGTAAVVSTTYIRAVRQFLYSPPISADEQVAVPTNFELGQNFPNPFNPSTVIPFSLDKQAHGELSIFNVTGQVVQQFDLSGHTAGEYQLVWNGKNSAGMTVPSGQYFARLSHDARVQVRKLTLIK